MKQLLWPIAVALCWFACRAGTQSAPASSLDLSRLRALPLDVSSLRALPLDSQVNRPRSSATAERPPPIEVSASLANSAQATGDKNASIADASVTTKNPIAWIYEKASFSSEKIGYFRAGSRIEVEREPFAGRKMLCGGTWLAVRPRGFVCEGREGVTRDFSDARVEAFAQFPPHDGPAPWPYANSLGAPLYSLSDNDHPGGTRTRASTPLHQVAYAPRETFLGLLDTIEHSGHSYYLTSGQFLIAKERVLPQALSEFHGVELAHDGAGGASGVALPLVWVRHPGAAAVLYRFDGEQLVETPYSLLYPAYAEATGRVRALPTGRFLELRASQAAGEEGDFYVREGDTVLIESREPPDGIAADEIWIDVNTSKQSLVLYEGRTPTFATLVSTGDGTGSHITPVGQFRVYQKLVFSTLRAPPKPDLHEPGYRFDDVPHVQYIVGNIALHAAYWHDSFGVARSHGCINLSPLDAARLFDATLPHVPTGWHAVNVLHGDAERGTLVAIHR